MKLKDYITTVGEDLASELFNTKQRTIKSWRLGERVPNRTKAKLIERATKGKVTFIECYEDV